jgi:hypothetical protein
MATDAASIALAFFKKGLRVRMTYPARNCAANLTFLWNPLRNTHWVAAF